jgi:hypothetical protein
MENSEFGSVAPSELRPYLPRPHTGKASLTRPMGTGNEREANRLAIPWIADFQVTITSAASITENPHGYDWITRYRAYHHGQNRFLLRRVFSHHTRAGTTGDADQTGSPLIGSSCPGRNRRTRRRRANRTWRQRWPVRPRRLRELPGLSRRDDRRRRSVIGLYLERRQALEGAVQPMPDNEHITLNPMACIKYSAGDPICATPACRMDQRGYRALHSRPCGQGAHAGYG